MKWINKIKVVTELKRSIAYLGLGLVRGFIVSMLIIGVLIVSRAALK